MIVRLMPEQVSGFWNLIKTGVIDIGNRMTPGNWNIANNVFNRCLAGLMQIWLCSEELEGKPNFVGFFITAIETDKIDDSRNLNISYTYAFKTVSDELIKEAVEVVNKYAKEDKCNNITFVSLNSKVDIMAEKAWPGKLKKLTSFSIRVEDL